MITYVDTSTFIKLIVEIDETLANSAADLAEKHSLRGYDAVHVASALRVGALVFSTSDRDLSAAASAEGMHVTDPQAYTAT